MPSPTSNHPYQGIKKICRHLYTCSARLTNLIALIILGWCFIFLYLNCYTMAHTIRVVSSLKTQIALNVIDMTSWEKINKELAWKKQPLQDNLLLRNPFE